MPEFMSTELINQWKYLSDPKFVYLKFEQRAEDPEKVNEQQDTGLRLKV